MDPVFNTVPRMAGRVVAVVAPLHQESLQDGEEVENRLAVLNQRYATAAAAAAEANAEFKCLRGSQSASASAVEAKRRHWVRLEQWRRNVDAAIVRLEDVVT
jgi:hypothetical protein